ncbi:MAG: PIG-L family deacetylase [Bacteroidota bacterium]
MLVHFLKDLRITLHILTLFILVSPIIKANENPYTSSNIQLKLEKLGVLGSVLYLAAHPDDENQRVITYMANEMKLRSGYLSLTRGDGGQNLIGDEIRDELGLIRTQELIEARNADGGKQFFSRAIDFGYSKNPDETLKIWDKEKVLADVVWVIRKFRPDIIVTRFPPDSRAGHGHHTASAQLAMEAFDISNDPDYYPEQLEYVEPWQPKRVFWNTHPFWFRNSQTKFDSSAYATIEVGLFNPLLGKSYNEIASESRSMHKSQGFGSLRARGNQTEFLGVLKGDNPGTNPLSGIDLSWSRVKGGNEIEKLWKELSDSFDPANPSKSTAQLIELRSQVEGLKNEFWRKTKLEEIDELLLLLNGVYVEANSGEEIYSPGDTIDIQLDAINRSNNKVKINAISITGINYKDSEARELRTNDLERVNIRQRINNDLSLSQPYWLANKPELGIFNVEDQNLIGKAENASGMSALVSFKIEGQNIDVSVPVHYKYGDPVEGEVIEPLVIAPKVLVNLNESQLIFANGQSRSVKVKIKALNNPIEGILNVDGADKWQVEIENPVLKLEAGEETELILNVIPPKKASVEEMHVYVSVGGQRYDQGIEVINYDHIKKQTYFSDASVKLIKLDLNRGIEKVGYIQGAGDIVPDLLRGVGYQVDELAEEDIKGKDLSTYDVIVLGVRAFNTVDRLPYFKDDLFKYVEDGGTMVVQYNTSFRLVDDNIAPYPLKLSRNRITIEEAPLKILQPKHPIFNYPNKITDSDFENWVQERGLYFASEWDEKFTPLLEGNDPGEDPTKGALLVTEYGKGHYVYTGLSWFRELPAGVPGAYRLFANILALD